MVINMVCDQTTGANQPTRTHDVIYKTLHTSIVLNFFAYYSPYGFYNFKIEKYRKPAPPQIQFTVMDKQTHATKRILCRGQ